MGRKLLEAGPPIRFPGGDYDSGHMHVGVRERKSRETALGSQNQMNFEWIKNSGG
jgi:hypothetical protein